MGDGRIVLKSLLDASFNKILLNEPTFGRIHLADSTFNADLDLASNLNADLDSGSQNIVDPSEFAVTKGFA
jgi:hypothetical protein